MKSVLLHWLNEERTKLRVLLDGVRGRYLFLFILSTASAILELASIGLVFPLLHLVLQGDSAGLPPIAQTLITIPPLDGNFERVALALILAFVAKNLGAFAVQYQNAKITNFIRGVWMKRLFKSYIGRTYAWFLMNKHGALVHNLFDLTDQCMSALRQLVNMFMYGISSIIVLTAMVAISWQVTLATLAIIGLTYALARPIMTMSMRLGKLRLHLYHEANNIPTESFKGIREIKTYSAAASVQHIYTRAVDAMVNLRVTLNFYQLLPGAFPEVLLITLLIGTLVILRQRGVDIATILPAIATYVYATYRLFINASALARDVAVYTSHIPSLATLAEALSATDNREHATGQEIIPTSLSDLSFSDVSFGYPTGKSVLSNVSFVCKPNTFTAIIGPSGSGKSTLADLIIRLSDPTSGRLTYGNIDISRFSVSNWRYLIGFVSQDTFLFHGTIRENIAFGLAPSLPHAEIVAASVLAHAHDFIMAKPKGYDTLVGERGALLSGGQRQRIALARALVRKPRLLILDEATSALDQESQGLIMDTLEELRRSMTIIMITHQVSLLRSADQIIFLKEGQLVEQRTYEQLIKNVSPS